VLLAIVERLGGLASALAWGTRWFVPGLVLVVGVAGAHRFVRAALRRTATATALERVVAASLESRRGAMSIEATSVAIIDGAHHAARAVVDLAVPIVADVITAICGVAILASFSRQLVFGGAIVVVLAVAMGLLLLLGRPPDDAFRQYVAVLERVTDAFDGRGELVASGAGDAFIDRTRDIVRAWQRAARRSSVSLLSVGRWPAVAAAIVAVAIVAFWPGAGRIDLRHGLVLAIVAPICVGVVRNAYELAKAIAQVSPLGPLFEERLAQAAGGRRPSPTSLTWDAVTVAFDDKVVLAEATLEALPGEPVALMGANGAGKTTLLLAALGLRSLAAGRIRVGGVDLALLELNGWRRRVAYLPQRPYLLPRRTVREAMSFPARDVDATTLEEALRRVELWQRLVAFPCDPLLVPTDALSAGERQRLALARLFTSDADVYLLDEPDANLDAAGVKLVAELISGLAEKRKVVVCAVHSTEVAEAAQKVVRLVSAKIVTTEPQPPKAVNGAEALRH
jgi:ATP-binding cassette subfamily C protein CydCD